MRDPPAQPRQLRVDLFDDRRRHARGDGHDYRGRGQGLARDELHGEPAVSREPANHGSRPDRPWGQDAHEPLHELVDPLFERDGAGARRGCSGVLHERAEHAAVRPLGRKEMGVERLHRQPRRVPPVNAREEGLTQVRHRMTAEAPADERGDALVMTARIARGARRQIASAAIRTFPAHPNAGVVTSERMLVGNPSIEWSGSVQETASAHHMEGSRQERPDEPVLEPELATEQKSGRLVPHQGIRAGVDQYRPIRSVVIRPPHLPDASRTLTRHPCRVSS